MQIIISARHVDVSESLRAHVQEQFERLTKFDPRVSRIEVTLTEEKNRCIAEAVLSVDRESPVHAEAESEEFRSAVDRLRDKLSRQLKKRRSRRLERRAPVPDVTVTAEEPEV
jgi:putative sigma-54 modulation protein